MSKIQEADLKSQVGERIHDVGTHRDKQEDCKAGQGEAHGQEAENPQPHYQLERPEFQLTEYNG